MATNQFAKISKDFFTEYQWAWIRDESQMKLAEKSRRIGWTYATSYRRVTKAMRVPGLDCWVSTRDLSTAKEFVRDCARWCRLAGVVAKGLDWGDNLEEIADIKAQVIEFPNASRIYVLTSNPDALAGKGGDVVLDEFALHKDQLLLWQVAQPTASVWGYQIEVISTHRGKNTQFNKFCTDAKGPNRMEWSFYSVNIVQACEQGLIDRINAATAKRGLQPITKEQFIERQRARCATDAQWLQEYMCTPQDDLGSLLTYELISGCSRPWEELTAQGRGPQYIGMDIGRKRDLSVIWRDELVGEVGVTREVRVLEKCPFHQQLDVLSEIIAAHDVRRVCIDETGIGAMLAEEAQRRHGAYLVEPVQFTAPVKEEMAMAMLRAFQDKAVVVPDDYDIVEDLHKVEKQVTSAGNIRYVATRDDDGHADRFWAKALAQHARSNVVGPPRGMRIAPENPLRATPGEDRPNHSDDLENRPEEWAGVGALEY